MPLFLLKIQPKKSEVIYSLILFSLFYTLACTLKFLQPSLFVTDTETEFEATSFDEAMLNGFSLLTISMYFKLQELKDSWSMPNFIYVAFILTFLLLIGNRSTFFVALILNAYMFMRIKAPFKLGLLTLIAAIGVYFMYDSVIDMIDETKTQLDNADYNRNKAFEYFIYSSCPNICCTIFGNGFLSSHATDQMAFLREMGIVNSDLGFVGYWNQFGLIPIFVFLYLYLRTIFKRRFPIYLKLVSIQTLACALTISYFGNLAHMLFFIMFYYLYCLEKLRSEDPDEKTLHHCE
ncbi:MAG: hypothetical protein NC453_16455 [Muribaculum sp.]|nr:hypothetical protein [Muribaculum sp.]